MAEAVVGSADITVLGGPATVSVDVDFGPQGTRGSYIYNIPGVPGPSNGNMPTDIKLNDIAINIQPGDDYLSAYQYISAPGGNAWSKMFVIGQNHNSYDMKETLTYSASGATSFTIPIATLNSYFGLASTNESIDMFVINFVLEDSTNNYPMSSSISTSSNLGNLKIDFKTAALNGSWGLLASGQTRTLHLSITLKS